MAFLVNISQRATLDLEFLFRKIDANNSTAAAKWFNGLEQAIQSLSNLPLRCPAAPERRKNGQPLRHLLYGNRPNLYRVIFAINKRTRTITVLTVRHGAMDAFQE